MKQFNFGPEVKEEGVAEVHVWETGLVVMTKRYQFWAATSLTEPRAKKLANADMAEGTWGGKGVGTSR